MTTTGLERQHGFASALLDPGRPVPAGLGSWNGSDVASRYAVHRNNVLSSLVEALAATFPVVAELVGEAFFRRLAAQFARACPPRDPVLALYGDRFADFIADDEAAAALPYLADVARLEFARVRACHSADRLPIEQPIIDRALSCGEQTADLVIGLHPSLSVLWSRFAIVSIWGAHQGDADLGQVDPMRAETAIVLRMDNEVLVLPASNGAAAFVESLLRGDSLGQSAGVAASADDAFDLAGSIGLLFRHCAITSIHLPEGCPP